MSEKAALECSAKTKADGKLAYTFVTLNGKLKDSGLQIKKLLFVKVAFIHFHPAIANKAVSNREYV